MVIIGRILQGVYAGQGRVGILFRRSKFKIQKDVSGIEMKHSA